MAMKGKGEINKASYLQSSETESSGSAKNREVKLQ